MRVGVGEVAGFVFGVEGSSLACFPSCGLVFRFWVSGVAGFRYLLAWV